MNSTTPIKFHVESEIISIGQDPEFADMGNPRGEIYRECYFVTAEINGGEMYRHHKGWQTEDEATAFMNSVSWAVENGRPLDQKYWYYNRCMYGSDAYIKNGRGDRELLEWENNH